MYLSRNHSWRFFSFHSCSRCPSSAGGETSLAHLYQLTLNYLPIETMGQETTVWVLRLASHRENGTMWVIPSWPVAANTRNATGWGEGGVEGGRGREKRCCCAGHTFIPETLLQPLRSALTTHRWVAAPDPSTISRCFLREKLLR